MPRASGGVDLGTAAEGLVVDLLLIIVESFVAELQGFNFCKQVRFFKTGVVADK